MACFSKCHFYSGLVQRAMWINSFEGSDTFLSIIESHLYGKVVIWSASIFWMCLHLNTPMHDGLWITVYEVNISFRVHKDSDDIELTYTISIWSKLTFQVICFAFLRALTISSMLTSSENGFKNLKGSVRFPTKHVWQVIAQMSCSWIIETISIKDHRPIKENELVTNACTRHMTYTFSILHGISRQFLLIVQLHILSCMDNQDLLYSWTCGIVLCWSFWK